jgi:predicted RecA/RadA family phage recombinase
MATFVQDGKTIDYTPSGSNVDAGGVIVIGELVALAPRAIKDGELGQLIIEGIVSFPKATGGSTAIAMGANVYWAGATGVATTTATGNKLIGKCMKAAADGDATVLVKFNQ